MDANRKKALDAALGQIVKQFGKGAVIRLGDSALDNTLVLISPGPLSLDVLLGIVAFPLA